MAANQARHPQNGFAILQGIRPFHVGQLPADMIGGLTLAALAIPEVIGYSNIAGMPVVTGLYTMLVPMALYAIFGGSRHLVVGADSATAAIMAAGLAGMATQASPEYVALAGVLALMAAALLILARVVRLSFLADFLSRTVLIGFLTGVGIQIAIGQLPDMTGATGISGGPIAKLIGVIQQLPAANPYELAVSMAVLAIILVARRISRKIPGALIAVIGAIFVSKLVDLGALGVRLLGPVPGGLPHISIPVITADSAAIQQLLPIAFSMFVVIIAQSAATSRAYAAPLWRAF